MRPVLIQNADIPLAQRDRDVILRKVHLPGLNNIHDIFQSLTLPVDKGRDDRRIIHEMYTGQTLRTHLIYFSQRPSLLLIQVEHLFQINAHRAVVRVGFHDIRHIVPPFLYDFRIA